MGAPVPARGTGARQRRGGARSVQRPQGRAGGGVVLSVSQVVVQRPVRGVSRQQKVCKACIALYVVEDVRHFLLEYPAYGVFWQRHPRFDPCQRPLPWFSIIHPDQAAVASVVNAMFMWRAGILSSPLKSLWPSVAH